MTRAPASKGVAAIASVTALAVDSLPIGTNRSAHSTGIAASLSVHAGLVACILAWSPATMLETPQSNEMTVEIVAEIPETPVASEAPPARPSEDAAASRGEMAHETEGPPLPVIELPAERKQQADVDAPQPQVAERDQKPEPRQERPVETMAAAGAQETAVSPQPGSPAPAQPAPTPEIAPPLNLERMPEVPAPTLPAGPAPPELPPIQIREPDPVPPPPVPAKIIAPIRRTDPPLQLSVPPTRPRPKRAASIEPPDAKPAARVPDPGNSAKARVQKPAPPSSLPENSATPRSAPARPAPALPPAAPAVSLPSASAYGGIVAAQLSRFKRYPDSARAAGAQGHPVVRFSLDASGNVLGAGLAGSSGNADIDREAVAMVRRAAPFPAPPPGAQRRFSIGINFRLS